MKSIKYLVVLACMTLGLASVAKAQIYSNEICFYQRTDKENEIKIVKFNGDRVLVKSHYSGHNLTQNLKESIDWYENDRVWELSYYPSSYERPIIWDYDYELSTSSKEVYKGLPDSELYRLYQYKTDGNSVKCRMAFSKDLSSFILFNIDKKVPVYFIRVNKEDLLPKALNPNEFDFLNE